MCIIVSKERGIEMPSKEILKNCFNYNSDGAGLMYVTNGKVNIVKGFMTFNSFYSYIEKLEKAYDMKEKAIVMHFRISTQGNVDEGNCHPYPITRDEKKLRTTNIRTDIGMAHNGIISLYSRSKGKLNDTQLFVKECVSTLKRLNKGFYKDYHTMKLLDTIAGSKLCFLDANEDIYYVGNFIEDDGIKYSNTTYKSFYRYPKYSSYITEYEDYDFMYYEDIKEKKKSKKDEQSPLTEAEFNFLMDYITILDKGDELIDEEGYKFTVDDDDTYGMDSYFNVYYIDRKEHDMYEIFSNCTIVHKRVSSVTAVTKCNSDDIF